MKPLRDLVLIEMEEVEQVKKGGMLYAAPKWPVPENIGKVVAIGEHVSNIKVGERYIVQHYALIDTQEKQVKLIKEKDILCHIKKTK
jgi:co-chaperonin GroES (HSP10)